MRRKAVRSTSFFTQALCSQLLLGVDAPGDAGHVVAVLPAALSGTGNTFSIADVLASPQLGASVVFLTQPVGETLAAQQAFVTAFLALLPSGSRALAWVPDPAAMPAKLSGVANVLLDGTGANVTTSANLTIGVGPTLFVCVNGGLPVSAGTTSIAIGASPQQTGWVTFSGPSALWSGNVFLEPATVPCTGPNRGCVQFDLFTQQSTLNWGFTFGTGSDPSAPQSLCAPLAVAGPKLPGVAATFDPLDPGAASNRHALAFLGTNLDRSTTVLQSCYTTPDGGTTITLTPVVDQANGVPARLVYTYPSVTIAVPQYLSLQPDGDFVVGFGGSSVTSATMLCGLQGAEYVTVHAGDVIRFAAGNPAFAPTFPFPTSSPVAKPFDPAAPVLNAAWKTSWATLRAHDATLQPNAVVAQPPGFTLYGKHNDVHEAHPNLYGHADPATTLSAAPPQPFPLVPYLGVTPENNGTTFSAAQVAAFESQVIGPSRHAAIGKDTAATRVVSARNSRSARLRSGATAAGDTTVNVTTPSGYLVTLDEDPATGATTWAKILLARLIATGQDFAFDDPDANLQQAFQAGQLLLVVANAQDTGGFANTLTIGEWEMAAQVGSKNAYGDYADILIVKAVGGALYDPDAADPSTNLVASPSKWTMGSTFAAPGSDATQLPNLSLWLQQYFADAFTARAQDPAYFQSFCDLARDPNWTGVLVLRGTIVEPPAGIAGITAGVTAPELFNVHHLAVPLTPIQKTPAGPDVTQSSSVSGLIYYLDPSANPKSPQTPIPADPTQQYAFRLLSLKVLFANSALQAFSSYVQLTLRDLFGSVAQSVPAENGDAIVLTGSYQLVDGQPIYSMASTSDAPFALANGVLQRVEVTGVQMSTVKADPQGDTESAFAMTGFLDFAVVPGTQYGTGTTQPSVDLFGYGNAAGATLPRQGLAFQALTLTMTFPTAAPSTPPAFALTYDPMRFDLANSTPRAGSLVTGFRLQLTGYVNGSGTPAELGYLPVVAMMPAGTLGASWNGLAFRVDLGTPGHLAADAGLSSSLLLAWSPDAPADGSPFPVQVGLQLPGTAQGAPLISLQNVLKLSIGQVGLAYTTTADGSRSGFLLLLNEIALSFLGLLKIPPNGAVSFYVFGDPNGADALGWYAIYNNEPKAS